MLTSDILKGHPQQVMHGMDMNVIITKWKVIHFTHGVQSKSYLLCSIHLTGQSPAYVPTDFVLITLYLGPLLTAKKGSKFKEWLDYSTLEPKPNPFALEILQYLAYEAVAQVGSHKTAFIIEECLS